MNEQGDSDMTRMVLALAYSAMLFTLFGLMPAGTLSADVLLIEEVRQTERLDLPVNGMNQDEVRKRFGTPANAESPVGDLVFGAAQRSAHRQRQLLTPPSPGTAIGRPAARDACLNNTGQPGPDEVSCAFARALVENVAGSNHRKHPPGPRRSAAERAGL
jgi:hypothetical protein